MSKKHTCPGSMSQRAIPKRKPQDRSSSPFKIFLKQNR